MVSLTDDNISVLVVFLELLLEIALLVGYILGSTSSAVMQPSFFLTVVIIIFLVDFVFTLVFGLRGTVSHSTTSVEHESVSRRWLNIYCLHFLKVLFFNTILLILVIIWSGKYYSSVHNPEIPPLYTDFPGELEPFLIYRNLFNIGIVVVFLDFSSAFNLLAIIKYDNKKKVTTTNVKSKANFALKRTTKDIF